MQQDQHEHDYFSSDERRRRTWRIVIAHLLIVATFFIAIGYDWDTGPGPPFLALYGFSPKTADFRPVLRCSGGLAPNAVQWRRVFG